MGTLRENTLFYERKLSGTGEFLSALKFFLSKMNTFLSRTLLISRGLNTVSYLKQIKHINKYKHMNRNFMGVEADRECN